jgi:D-3-phosphoglycerate dehydrogenase
MFKKSQTPVAVASRSFSRHIGLSAELLSRYENVTFNDPGSSLAGESLINFLRGHPKAITALGREVLEALPELRVISKYGVGLEMIDLEVMEHYGVRLRLGRRG